MLHVRMYVYGACTYITCTLHWFLSVVCTLTCSQVVCSLNSLGPLVKKVKDGQIEVIINTLCNNMFSDSESLRDISSVGMFGEGRRREKGYKLVCVCSENLFEASNHALYTCVHAYMYAVLVRNMCSVCVLCSCCLHKGCVLLSVGATPYNTHIHAYMGVHTCMHVCG